MLSAAGTVPDHGELRPFRFAVISGDGRTAFGNALAEAARERNPALSDPTLDGIRAKAQRSPTIIAVIASPKPGKIEVWEQTATAACAGYAIVLAASARCGRACRSPAARASRSCSDSARPRR
jgi:nitroreductase